jgi:hypothetical protein
MGVSSSVSVEDVEAANRVLDRIAAEKSNRRIAGVL